MDMNKKKYQIVVNYFEGGSRTDFYSTRAEVTDCARQEYQVEGVSSVIVVDLDSNIAWSIHNNLSSGFKFVRSQ